MPVRVAVVSLPEEGSRLGGESPPVETNPQEALRGVAVEVAAPLLVTRCVSPDDLKSGQAFFVLSDNPLKHCGLVDYQTTDSAALYRIVCPGPNKGNAVAVFDTKGSTYRGTIRMNMGGKNMTMSETQSGKRIGDCR